MSKTSRIFKFIFWWYLNLFKENKLQFLGATFVIGVIFSMLSFFGIYFAVTHGSYGDIPSDKELKTIQNFRASEIYSSDSVLLGKYYLENRTEIAFEEVSPLLINALIATEDTRFYKHKGIDNRSFIRVFFKSIVLKQHAGGGSTISQQLVKNVFGRKKYGKFTLPINKLREAIIANKLERLYSKKEILMLYLNTVSFGEDTYGIDAGARRFFSKAPIDLTLEESAVLIGMLKAPTRYSPRVHPERSLVRRNIVFKQLAKYSYITKNVAKVLINRPLKLNYSRRTRDVGMATHFREYLRTKIKKWLVNHPKPDGSAYNLYTDGLKIYTTLHSKFQQYAEEAVYEHLEKLTPDLRKDLAVQGILVPDSVVFMCAMKRTSRYRSLFAKGLDTAQIVTHFNTPIQTRICSYQGEIDSLITPADSIRHTMSLLQAGFMVTDPQNGNIKAWVGGVSFKSFQYDHVLSRRQVGSVFKPIVYTQALLDGREPCEFVSNRKVTYRKYENWSPRNSNDKYRGKYSLVGALTNSINTISVKVSLKAGIDNIIHLAKKMGIKDSLLSVPSLALGVSNISLKSIIGAYGTLANSGQYIEPNSVLAIYDRENKRIYTPTKKAVRVLGDTTAHTMTNMLQSVVNVGTARRLRFRYKFKGHIAGKTGTTQNHTDGWFVGYTPKWLGGVWVGSDNPSIRFSDIRDGQGANMALPIWAIFHQKMEKGGLYEQQKFDFANNIDCVMYKKRSVLSELFTKGDKKSNETSYPYYGDSLKKKRKGFSIFNINK